MVQYTKENKSSFVSGIFSSVAQKYDLMNDLMSFGIHRLWKNKFIDFVNPQNGEVFLDVAGGTGDVAIRILKSVDYADVTVCDINYEMLTACVDKTIDSGIINKLKYVCGDAEMLPFMDNSVDCYTIVYGIRNVGNVEKVLDEARRVLRVGGRFVCMEFSKISNPLISKLYKLYSDYYIPVLGKYVASNEDAYQYLIDSIRAFPSQEKFKDILTKSGFKNIKYTDLMAGISTIYVGWN